MDKTLKELEGKVDEEEVKKAETARDELKAAVEANNIEEMKTKRDALNSSLRALSASAFASASFTIRSISSSVRPEEDLIVIFCSFCVPRSFADTFTIPFLSISNVTSICGIPRGAAGIQYNDPNK